MGEISPHQHRIDPLSLENVGGPWWKRAFFVVSPIPPSCLYERHILLHILVLLTNDDYPTAASFQQQIRRHNIPFQYISYPTRFDLQTILYTRPQLVPLAATLLHASNLSVRPVAAHSLGEYTCSAFSEGSCEGSCRPPFTQPDGQAMTLM